MDYKKELKKIGKGRKRYRPVLTMLARMHERWLPSDEPVELINREDVLVILELIDIGYLDTDALIVRTRFEDVVSLKYTGGYPFTDGGDEFIRRNRNFFEKVADRFRRS
ncbi:MAG: hypothetical protein JW807_15400 [Spirochaetes bacterium]|nr:hypothetical protein [Spirochaetota bacterium]